MPTIQRKSNGQYVVTIDAPIANAMDLDGGESAEWKIQSSSKLGLAIND